MKKLQSTFVLMAIVSSSVVFANTDFETRDANESAQVIEQFDELNVQSSGGPTENDFFEY